ncbi:hypothetical protein CIHG_08882 [Coccidioides immitis H538.4]|uniref:Uncharacterized protein n=3 Tax=Coccidioides immitis TaxID=5501 RepID=A0A0J8QZF8_COCIT|nr:hypothetical protein CIRG_05245 [Coccidioides immitis RMSCC 2394]KMU77871.1 hypothetical protein CISG_06714 [Coccidioides immitis RMSCC 3703]KMU91133.1 hypothetical protein CIHG_08882 [Coccidioides immitis H538.4]
MLQGTKGKEFDKKTIRNTCVMNEEDESKNLLLPQRSYRQTVGAPTTRMPWWAISPTGH